MNAVAPMIAPQPIEERRAETGAPLGFHSYFDSGVSPADAFRMFDVGFAEDKDSIATQSAVNDAFVHQSTSQTSTLPYLQKVRPLKISHIYASKATDFRNLISISDFWRNVPDISTRSRQLNLREEFDALAGTELEVKERRWAFIDSLGEASALVPVNDAIAILGEALASSDAGDRAAAAAALVNWATDDAETILRNRMAVEKNPIVLAIISQMVD